MKESEHKPIDIIIGHLNGEIVEAAHKLKIIIARLYAERDAVRTECRQLRAENKRLKAKLERTHAEER